jgi:hypothetical protein
MSFDVRDIQKPDTISLVMECSGIWVSSFQIVTVFEYTYNGHQIVWFSECDLKAGQIVWILNYFYSTLFSTLIGNPVVRPWYHLKAEPKFVLFLDVWYLDPY